MTSTILVDDQTIVTPEAKPLVERAALLLLNPDAPEGEDQFWIAELDGQRGGLGYLRKTKLPSGSCLVETVEVSAIPAGIQARVLRGGGADIDGALGPSNHLFP